MSLMLRLRARLGFSPGESMERFARDGSNLDGYRKAGGSLKEAEV